MKSFFLIILVVAVIAGVYYWLKQKEKTGLISGAVSDQGILPSEEAKAKAAWIRYSNPYWEDWDWFEGGNPGWSVEGEWFEDKSLIIQRYREGEFG